MCSPWEELDGDSQIPEGGGAQRRSTQVLHGRRRSGASPKTENGGGSAARRHGALGDVRLLWERSEAAFVDGQRRSAEAAALGSTGALRKEARRGWRQRVLVSHPI
jgi:hypothetical protein